MKKKMKTKIKTVIFFLLIMLSMYLPGIGNFNIINKWNYKNETIGYLFYSIIDKDGDIVGTFYMTGNKLITPEKVIKIAPRGQGPGDLMNIRSLFHYKSDIAFVESPEKIKIFTKEEGTYKIKDIIWLKRGREHHMVKDCIFFDNKFFFAGAQYLNITDKKSDVSFVKIYSDKGQPLKNLIIKTFLNPLKEYQSHSMNHYIVNFKNSVFFLSENDLKVCIISNKDLKVIKEVKLSIPGFYKKMPEDFYTPLTNNKSNEDYVKKFEYWQTAYSRIHKVIIEGEFLILQMRTCSDKLKKFALLFYNANNFKLEKTIYINDLLLGAKDGKYYFYANGDPGRDDEAEEFIIHIYGFGDKNEKE